MQRRTITTKWTVWLLLLALVMGAGGNTATAQNDGEPAASPEAGAPLPSFAIYPKATGPRTYFDVTQEAGTTERYTVVLANFGDDGSAPFVGRTYAANVHVRTNGGLDSGQPDEEKTGPTAWLDYPTEVLTLEPGTGIERTFEVTVPPDTKPGQYVAALSFETAEPIAIPGTPNLTQILRQTIGFVITVPGKADASFEIEDLHIVSDETWSGLEATLVNTGTVPVRPTGKITVSDLDGNPIATTDIGLGSFYAFTSGIIQTGFVNTLPAGDYLVTLELRDPETGAAAKIENQRVTTVTQGELAAVKAPPVFFSEAAAEVKPDVDHPQFLNVTATIVNNGEPVENAELSIAAYRDGKLVENYVMVSPLALPVGDTTISNRYIPVDGWLSGSWTFVLSIQARDRISGVATVLSTVKLDNPNVIP